MWWKHGRAKDPIQFPRLDAIRVTVRIEGASGTFDSIKAAADYQVSNEGCVPTAPISGGKVAPNKRVELSLAQATDGTYQTVVYVDQLMDEDYFGRGTCHWSPVAASVVAVKEKTRFSAGIFAEKILAKSSESTLLEKCPKRRDRYP